MNYLVVAFLAAFIVKSKALAVSCHYYQGAQYDCHLQNVFQVNESEEFEIFGDEHYEGKNDNDVTYLKVADSVIHYFPMKILEKFENLLFIILKDIQLQRLDPFENCNKLTSINLSYNQLQSLPKKVFDDCKLINWINLSRNSLTSIESDVFKELVKLNNIWIEYNLLKTLPENLFATNSRLTKLGLDKNPYTSPHDISSYFKGLLDTQEIRLQESSICEISERAFEGLSSLKFLTLYRNQISKLHPRSFVSLTGLEELYLYENNIIELDSSLFQSVINLRRLEIHSNQIKDFADGTFKSLKFLNHFTIDYNNFTCLKLNAFVHLSELEIFHIGNSNLEKFSSLFFNSFVKLSRLSALNTPCVNKLFAVFKTSDLNQFSECYSKVLTCLYGDHNLGYACEIKDASINEKTEITMIDGLRDANSLLKLVHYVHASDSLIEVIPQIIFDEFNELLRLELINVGLKELRNIKNCSKLQWLSLEKNNIQYLPENIFENCSSLKEIRLTGIKISSVKAVNSNNLKFSDQMLSLHPNVFIGQEKLTHLNISWYDGLNFTTSLQLVANLNFLVMENNGIEFISNEAFQSLRKLSELILKFNRISTIHSKAFNSLTRLVSLDLSNNNLSSLDKNIFNNLISLTVLNLDRNYFKIWQESFETLTSLTKLSLADNHITSLTVATNFPFLHILDLSNNQIDLIDKKIFDFFPTIRNLNLTNNDCVKGNFEDVESFAAQWPYFNICFDNFVISTSCVFHEPDAGYACMIKTNESMVGSSVHNEGKSDADVKYLFIKSEPLPVELHLILDKFKNIEKLELWKTSITKIDFINICSNLRSFDMRFNQLKKFSSGIFSKCEKLEKLILVKNEINEIAENGFEGLTSLTLLDLSFNNIETIADGLFEKLTSLKMLNLSRNKLLNIANWVSTLKSLSILNLSHNEITVVSFDGWSSQNSIKELKLNNNKITEISLSPFGNFQNLVYLSIQDNELTNFDLTSFVNLRYLDLSKNEIAQLPN